MVTSVFNAFEAFNREIVNLDSDRVLKARTSRDWLSLQLENLHSKAGDFPNLYDGKHINFGSFSRKTKIRELNDIDLILTFSADGAKYETIIHGKYYRLTVPYTNTNLFMLTNDDNKTLNSKKVVNKIVNALTLIPNYSKAEIHRKEEAATLQLSSYEWNFDIVPAFYTDTGYYLIPDGSGDWKATDPRVDQTRATEINQKHNGKILQIIRTLKYWQRRNTMPTIPSYLFEVIILNYYSNKHVVSDYIDLELRDFFLHLYTAIFQSYQDPKGFSGELNKVSNDEKSKISEKALNDYVQANQAIKLELQDKNQEQSINKWAEIFGGYFPKYG